MVAATLLIASPDISVGSAAFYSADYDDGGWEAIIAARARWGQIDRNTFPYSPQGYYCVSPDHELGEQLVVQNAMTGKRILCTVADVVAPRDLAHWRAHVVIELSWAAFVAVDATEHNRVVVYSG